MAAKVSVLMPVCNGQKYVNQAIESILNQTFSDYEFLIVDNGSTDKTWDIINSYKDERIKCFKLPIKQLAFSLNYGILHSKAEYIVRMDSDDISHPKRIEAQVSFLDNNPDVAVLGTAINIFNDQGNIKSKKFPLDDITIRKKLPFLFTICHPSVALRKSVIIENGGYASKFNEDLDLWLRLFRNKNIKFANLPDHLLKYRIHPDQIRGSKESYSATIGLLFRESFNNCSPYYFAAALFACIKSFRAYKK